MRLVKLTMAMRPARRKSRDSTFSLLDKIAHRVPSIIQDCEDALTNWVTANASVSSKLSTRARTLSQRRKNRTQGEGVDLSGQDSNLQGQDRESGLWVPAGAHREYGHNEEEEEEEEEEESAEGHAEHRGRESQEPVAA